ncbi:MAG: type IV pilus modification protein PilV [Gammaproteobacteria bacterium]|nr:type IV pilus modification protein PilV [Gammaproteobacteria bacterium]
MVEVLVALVIIAFGLLGIAKIQALAYASTGTAGLRSLAAIEASGMASAMRANRLYWASGLAPDPITVQGNAIVSADAALAAPVDCAQGGANAPCTPHDLAAFDLQAWANDLRALLPNDTAIVSCPVINNPISCTIQIGWTEHLVAINAQGASGAGMAAPTFVVYVQP